MTDPAAMRPPVRNPAAAEPATEDPAAEDEIMENLVVADPVVTRAGGTRPLVNGEVARRGLAAFASGLVFGLGLVVSGMTNPAKVIGFLDVFGHWDPSLALVMAAALVVTAIGYRLVWRAPRPLVGRGFQMPANRRIDARLAGGAALFGVGWGLVGLCPGPAIASIASGERVVLVFIVAMAFGMAMNRLWRVFAERLADSRASDRTRR